MELKLVRREITLAGNMMAAAQVNVTGDFHFSSSEDEDSAAVPPPPPDIDTENIATYVSIST